MVVPAAPAAQHNNVALQALMSMKTDMFIDQTPLIAAMGKIIDAFQQLQTENTEQREANVALKNEIQAIRRDVKSLTASQKKQAELVAKVESLTIEVSDLQALLRSVDMPFIKTVGDTMGRVQSTVRTQGNTIEQLTAEMKSDRRKAVDTETEMRNETRTVSQEVSKLFDIKANNTDVIDLRRITQQTTALVDKCSEDVEGLGQSQKEFVKDQIRLLKDKATCKEVADKLGRAEADEMLQALSVRVGGELHKNADGVNEMREDVDFMLQIMLQKEESASGAFKCLSCSKLAPLQKPGPSPASGRSPVITAGSDGVMYKAKRAPVGSKEDLDVGSFRSMTSSPTPDRAYTPQWAGSQSGNNSSVNIPGQSPSTRSRPQSASGVRSNGVNSAMSGAMTRPNSVASPGRPRSAGKIRPSSATNRPPS